jgi:N-acetylglucosaminyl-diphospho-decaprenol L-rhamnosyltransferase
MVDAVVVTSNSRELVLRCLEHLTDPAIEHVVVVDNASSDGTVEAIKAQFPEVEAVRFDRHSGLSSAFNAGAERTSAPLILFLNDDIFATEGAVARLVAELEARPDAASAGGRLVDADEAGATQDRYRPRSFPTLLTFFMGLTGADRLWKENPWSAGHLRDKLNDRDTVEVDQPAGAVLLVRREAFEAIGGWDETFSFWYEDVDISRRLAARGKALYVPSAAFQHLGGGTVLRWDRAQIAARTHWGILRYAEKHFSRLRRIGLAMLIAALALPWIALGAVLPRRYGDVAQVQRRALRSAIALARGKPVPRLARDLKTG